MREQKNLVVDCGDGGGVIITLNDLRALVRKENILADELYGPDDAAENPNLDPTRNPVIRIPKV